MDEETGNSSRLIDLPNGGFALISGNLLMQGPYAENNNMVGYGLEGLTTPASAFYFVANTLVNKREASCRFLQIASGTAVAEILNNIFAGSGNLVEGLATRFEGNVDDPVIENFHFINEPDYDYRLNNPSPAIDAGLWPGMVNGCPLLPESEYLHPADSAPRSVTGNPDAGAYEFEWPASAEAQTVEDINLRIDQNMLKWNISVEYGQVLSVFLSDFKGNIHQLSQSDNGYYPLDRLNNGLYILRVETSKTSVSQKIFIP
jgi:hypothetical protein